MAKVNSFKQGAFLLLALVGLINLSYAQTRCGSHNTTPTGCTGFKTYTQGGWGSGSCSRSNSTPGNLLKNNFATLFPNGLEIGCTRKLRLTTPYAVAAFLPSGGTPTCLPSGTLTNPTNYNNTLAGQLVAAMLNVRFDDGISSFSSSTLKLKNLIIASGPFAGWTVQQLIDEANKKIGVCAVSSFSYSQFNEALTNVNENYDNGTVNDNFLNCPPTCSNVTTGGTISGNEAKCGGYDPAEITSSTVASGGSGTLEYAWFSSSNGSDWTLIAGANSANYNPSVISATTYYKRSAKRNTCPDFGASSNVIVKTVNSSPSASITKTTHVLCFEGSTGSVNLTVTGGKPAYSFAWSNGSTSEDLAGVGAGTYNVVVTDANGCIANASTTVNQPASAVSASATATDVKCFEGMTGSVNLTVSGGTGNYTFAWDNGSTSEDLSGVAAGTYNVMVTDANGCKGSASATVNQPSSALSASASATDVKCFGGMTGSVDLTVAGGTSGYSFAWDNGSTSEDLSGVAAGTYNVEVTDANGCKTNATATVNGPSAALQGSAITTKNVNCFGGSNGMIDLTVTGGTAGYSFAWDNGATTEDLSGLVAGTYSVTITDANGCTTTASSEVTQPAVLTLGGTTTPVSACECNGTAALTISGGTEPYSYAWSNGTTGVSTLTGICKGTSASVTVTDANGCTATYNFNQTGFQGGCSGTEIVEFHQGPRADGSPVDAARSNPDLAKGTPENTNLEGTFYSLGFGGSVVVKIAGGIYNHPGNDLRVVETTYWAWGCQRYSERARVYISVDNVNWVDKGEICQDGEFDIWPLQCIRYVKIVDTSVPETFVDEPVLADGFDVDGVECIGISSGRAAVSSTDEELDGDATTKWITRSLQLYPNPAEANLNLELTGAVENETIQVTVIDQVGRIVKSMDVKTGAGLFRMDVPIQDLTHGMYTVSVKGTNLNLNQKVIKK